MFSIKQRRSRRGYILIYVLFIGSLALFIASACYREEFLVRGNNLEFQKNSLKVDVLQKYKEYLLTELDEYIFSNVINITQEEIKQYFGSLINFSLMYEECSISYIPSRDCFLIEYYLNHKFYKEELYEYKVSNGTLNYRCIDYSFERGRIVP